MVKSRFEPVTSVVFTTCNLPVGLTPTGHQFLYYEYLKTIHLFDVINIGKNVTKCLWKLIDGSNKEKNSRIISDIEEANVMQHLTHFYSDGKSTNLPWLLTE